MRIFFIGLGCFVVFMFGVRRYAMCEIWHKCTGESRLQAFFTNAATPSNTISVYRGDSLLLGGFESFELRNTSVSFTPSPNNTILMDKLLAFLAKIPTAKLVLVGYTPINEPITSFYESEGLRRAALLRKSFLQRVEAMTPEQTANIQNRLVIDDSITMNNPPNLLGLKIIGSSDLTMNYEFERMTFYDDNFVRGEATLQPKSAFINYSDSLHAFLKQKPNTIITVHTHINQKQQQKIAFQRAQTLHRYFVALGLLSDNIKLNIMIDDSPLATSNNLDPALKNNRFEIEIAP